MAVVEGSLARPFAGRLDPESAAGAVDAGAPPMPNFCRFLLGEELIADEIVGDHDAVWATSSTSISRLADARPFSDDYGG